MRLSLKILRCNTLFLVENHEYARNWPMFVHFLALPTVCPNPDVLRLENSWIFFSLSVYLNSDSEKCQKPL